MDDNLLKISSLYQDLEANSQFVPSTTIVSAAKAKNEAEQTKAVLQTKLKEGLHQVRSGKAETTVLDDWIAELQSGNLSSSVVESTIAP